MVFQDVSSTEVIIDHVEEHLDLERADFENLFPRDKKIKKVFDEFRMLQKKLCKIFVRHLDDEDEDEDEKRCNFVNSLLVDSFKVRKKPKYDIVFEHISGQKQIKFMKKLYSGWHVQIGRSDFDKLVYDDNVDEKLSKSVHLVYVKGDILRFPGFSETAKDKMEIIYCCYDHSVHVERNEQVIKQLEERNERVNHLKIGRSASKESWWPKASKEEEDENENENENESEMNYKDDDFQLTSVEIKCFDNVSLEKLVIESYHCLTGNMEKLSLKFSISKQEAHFSDKCSYWKGLRENHAASQQLIVNLFDACLGGKDKSGKDSVIYSGAQDLAEEYLRDCHNQSKTTVINNLIKWQCSLTMSSGFISGFGGFITMPITIPAGLLATWITSARLAFAIAYLEGFDIFHPIVCNAVLHCLTGSSNSDEEKEIKNSLRSLSENKKNQKKVCQTLVLLAQKEEEKQNENFKKHFKNLYDLLGVEKNASQKEIRVAYRRMAMQFHPDKVKNKSPEMIQKANSNFQILSAAYEQIGDEENRKKYDAKLKTGWSWSQFSYSKVKAQKMFDKATKQLTEALLAPSHDIGAHAASRTLTKVAVETAETVGNRSAQQALTSTMYRAATNAELESSVLIGEKLAANATTRSSSKLIPLVGAFISGAIDCATTASVGRCAKKLFDINH